MHWERVKIISRNCDNYLLEEDKNDLNFNINLKLQGICSLRLFAQGLWSPENPSSFMLKGCIKGRCWTDTNRKSQHTCRECWPVSKWKPEKVWFRGIYYLKIQSVFQLISCEDKFEMEKCAMAYILAWRCCCASLYFHWKENCRNSERMHVHLTWLWPTGKAFFSNHKCFLMIEEYSMRPTHLDTPIKWAKIFSLLFLISAYQHICGTQNCHYHFSPPKHLTILKLFNEDSNAHGFQLDAV